MSALVAGGGCKPPVAPRPPQPALRLVVLIVIDQWPSWGFAQRRDLYEHGLGRLIDEGVVYKQVEYPYATTFTAPGHAAIGTGQPPSVTGIVANGWWRREQRRERQAEADDRVTILPLPGRPSAGIEGASGAALRVDGIADWMREASGGKARSVVIGGKPRAACLVAGRRPDVVLWYEPKLKGMTSSTAYAEALPGWVLALDRERPVADLLDDEWTAGDAAMLRRRTGIDDAAPGEGAEHGLGIEFPYRLATATDPAKALRSTPLLDRVEIETAIAAIPGEQLGADDVTDLLVVSLSAHDYVGHNWGQESWEMIEHERALDAEIGRLLTALDGAVGARNYAVVLTSDHGATPLVEHGTHPGARRIPPAELEAAAEAAAATVFGPGDWVSSISSAMVYLSPAAHVRSPSQRARALDAITTRLAAVPQVARVIPLDALPASCADLDELSRRACFTRVAGETGELLVVPTDGSLVTSYTTGTSHDAPSSDNNLVPLIVRIPGTAPATVSTTGSILSVAPLLRELVR